MRTIFATLSLVIAVVLLVAAALLLHPFGQPPSPMDDYIIQNAQAETGTNNVVAAVLFDYRGFDTLAECTVLFTAVTGVLMLLTARRKKERKHR